MATPRSALTAAVLVTGILSVIGENAFVRTTRGAEPVKAQEKIEKASPNTWVVLQAMKTGKRESPLVFWAPEIKRLVRASGGRHYKKPNDYQHYDTEEFDPATATWVNAYPKGADKGRAVSGPIQSGCKLTSTGRYEFLFKDGDLLRVSSRHTFNTCAYVPPEKNLYVVYRKKLHTYDPAARTWSNVDAPPLEIDGRWGSLAYDPVNGELVYFGGHGSRGRTTWIFDLTKRTWRQLPADDTTLSDLHAATRDLLWQATELLGRAVNRFTIAETPEERKDDLGARAERLAASLKDLAAGIGSAKIAPRHSEAAQRAAEVAAEVSKSYSELKGGLGVEIAPELLADLRRAKRRVVMTRFALSPLPPARALSPLACDPVSGKLILFGGERMDCVLSDTWVYDCKTRTWSQRFPEKAPKPRAGHILDWLPGAKKVVLTGGYTRGRLDQDLWVYDAERNTWTCLNAVPVKRIGRTWASPDCPMANPAGYPLAGDVGPGDTLLVQPPMGNEVYACRVDPGAAVPKGAEASDGEPGALAYNGSPAAWEKVASPDAGKTKAYLANLKPNVWTEIKTPRYAPGARNRWGTTAYDPERKQFLFWGGGHATSKDNEVAHFSLRGGCWTISYPPDYPLNPSSYMSWGGTTFSGRPAMPWAHAYQAYEYSPGGKMCLLNSVYDVRAREWQQSAKGLKSKGLMKSMVEYTPHGAVCLSEAGLLKYDATKNEWSALPWKGPAFGKAWCDGHALCYDSERDCLWAANTRIFKYDFKSGTVEKLPVTPPSALGRGKRVWSLWR